MTVLNEFERRSQVVRMTFRFVADPNTVTVIAAYENYFSLSFSHEFHWTSIDKVPETLRAASPYTSMLRMLRS